MGASVGRSVCFAPDSIMKTTRGGLQLEKGAWRITRSRGTEAFVRYEGSRADMRKDRIRFSLAPAPLPPLPVSKCAEYIHVSLSRE
jgi:hypothetical protein